MMGATDFLFTPTVPRVLGITLTQPGRAFTLRELIRQTASGRGRAQQQIDRLVQAGVLAEEPRRGQQRSIRANTEHFLYPELRSIALKTFGLVEPLREALQAHADRIQEAFIFGSVAKGSDTGTSDIGILVVGTLPQMDLFEATTQLQEALGRRVYFNVYEPAEWCELVKSGSVISQIVNGPKRQVLPPAPTD